jgi:protein-S-isoprenylcysteine O-methyltransferase Ste14
MRPTLLAALMISLVATASSAQGMLTDDQAKSKLHRGTLKVWLGSALVGVGSLVVPLTATSSRDAPNDVQMGVGVVTVAAGTGLIWWGVREQRKAVRPLVNIEVFVGKSAGIQFRKTW